MLSRLALIAVWLALASLPSLGQAQESPPTAEQVIQAYLDQVVEKFVTAAQEFPEELYAYRPNEDTRTFAEIVMHVASSNRRVAFRALTEGAGLEAVPPDVREFRFVSKQQAVEKLKESFAAVRRTMETEAGPKLAPYWLYVIQHTSEHFGNLVTYYRNNGLVPPTSR